MSALEQLRSVITAAETAPVRRADALEELEELLGRGGSGLPFVPPRVSRMEKIGRRKRPVMVDEFQRFEPLAPGLPSYNGVIEVLVAACRECKIKPRALDFSEANGAVFSVTLTLGLDEKVDVVHARRVLAETWPDARVSMAAEPAATERKLVVYPSLTLAQG